MFKMLTPMFRNVGVDEVAHLCYRLADAMIAQRRVLGIMPPPLIPTWGYGEFMPRLPTPPPCERTAMFIVESEGKQGKYSMGIYWQDLEKNAGST